MLVILGIGVLVFSIQKSEKEVVGQASRQTTTVVCGDGICQSGETCEWLGRKNRQMICDGKRSPVPSGVVCSGCKKYYDMKKVYSPKDFSLIWETDRSTEEKNYLKSWGDNVHFTFHRLYFNKGDTIQWCPRVDDVYVWSGDNLFYTDTFDFYNNKLTNYKTGHLWATRLMEPGIEITNSMDGTTYDITHKDCSVTNKLQVPGESSTHKTVAVIIENQNAWSPFTGGSSQNVPVFRLDEFMYIDGNKDDWWKEEWYFYNHPIYGYVPIYTKGYRKKPNTDMQITWDSRLLNIEKI